MAYYYGDATLSDTSRHNSSTGVSGFFYSISPPDFNNITSFIFDSTVVAGDQTFMQQQILGTGDLTYIFKEWGFFGGRQLDATTWTDVRRMTRWFDPEYLSYSIWYLNYDSSTYSLVDYRFRDPVRKNVGDYYAAMEVPQIPGHYQIRWLFYKDDGLMGSEVVKSFTALTKGVDPMRDYPQNPMILSGPVVLPETPPTVLVLPPGVTRNPGENTVFTLQITGILPLPLTYQWRKGGVNLTDSSHFSGVHTNTLTIYGIDFPDGGYYDCIVSSMYTSSIGWMTIDPP